jgi:hypothetical protein
MPELQTPLTGRPITLVFAVFLGCHILAGLVCVVTGAVALLSQKRRGRHTSWGEVYFRALVVVFATAAGMALLRWPQNAYLLVLGSISFGAASLGYISRKVRWPGWLTLHVTGMGVSYIVLLTAFYVDNGPHLPLWERLPAVAFWIGPSAVGLPLLFRTLRRRARPLSDVRLAVRAAAALSTSGRGASR